MRFFLAFIASIASLSDYTLVDVHAGCAVCPSKVANESLVGHCVDQYGDTICYYLVGIDCYYDVRTRRYTTFN
ncbi:hypothetical protein PAXRUDRAFT_238458 [Paxillus rubicundulus Ve08.2h10]|uniref:Unplaced genomic scaffold scaffold_1200, whole genome shotgun sequence n=1 Tax=Paxillus rubicundulus Ve08.2h10 TaxID=930991 RepID=A0A0D0CXY8_9AGAM|nr:hypothetical protein PAXRUDRAFT_238458 [Paxillus rubicundulus Ve08.2h10]